MEKNDKKNGTPPQPKCPNGHPADSAGQCRTWGCPHSSLPKPPPE